MNSVWIAFITGLTTGGVSCFAVQGGLLASSLSHQKKGVEKHAILVFLVFKLISYAILGILLGYLGSAFVISPVLQGYMQILAGVFMLSASGRLMDIHPFFRRLVITPPKFIFRLLRRKSIDDGLFAAGMLGLLTVLIPCGVTQAAILLAVSSGSPVWGSLIMFSFILGTSPVFFALGAASEKLLHHQSLKLIAALIVFYLGIISINTGQVLRGSPHNLQNYYLAATGKLEAEEYNNSLMAEADPSGNQAAQINISTYGYSSEVESIKVGIPVTLRLVTNKTLGCARAFTIPEYGISKILPETGMEIVDFVPTKTGRLTYTCSMGMYSGTFNVIN